MKKDFTDFNATKAVMDYLKELINKVRYFFLLSTMNKKPNHDLSYENYRKQKLVKFNA